MKILEGNYQGKEASIVRAVGRGPMLRIRANMLSVPAFRIPSEFETLKLINKDESRTAGQFILILLLGITVIGLPIAILLFLFWKRVDFSVGMKTKTGEKFVAQGNAGEWKVLKKYIGIGELSSF